MGMIRKLFDVNRVNVTEVINCVTWNPIVSILIVLKKPNLNKKKIYINNISNVFQQYK